MRADIAYFQRKIAELEREIFEQEAKISVQNPHAAGATDSGKGI